jgi:hypothetical protein
MPKIDSDELARFERAGLNSESGTYVKWVAPFESALYGKYRVHVSIHPDSKMEKEFKEQKVPGSGDKKVPVEVLVKSRTWDRLHVRYDREPNLKGDRPIYFWYTWKGIFFETPIQCDKGWTDEERELKGDADRVANKVFRDLDAPLEKK